MLKQLIRYFLIFLFCAACAGRPTYVDYDKMDYGLPKTPDKEEIFNVETENLDVYGVSNIDTFYIDISDDGKKDKIIRGYFANISAHGYTFYEIYLNNGEQVARFRTLEGADCFLEAYKFQFEPFILTKASRSWKDTWATPTPAKIEKYKITNNKLEKISEKSGGIICDVRELLQER
ncbi:MAG: hypothetical protein LBK26_03405 [Rickettsiales bacterium]|nr:hypothetical protein [Rickettsiales bacterium]